MSPEERKAKAELDAEEAVFAANLKDAMERLEVDRFQLASALDISPLTITLMLNRRCRPQRKTVQRLAVEMGINPDELWPGFWLKK